MGKKAEYIFSYGFISLLAFGILGNILVIISILKQKKLLKNNYYFLVLHLAICDLGYCTSYISLLNRIHFVASCGTLSVNELFLVAGMYMMLIIAVLRYRATAHPLKPAISRRKLKIFCGLGYILGLIAGCGPFLPFCLMTSVDDEHLLYYFGFAVICFYLFPTVFMAVVYYKIGRALMKQNKHMKRVCSNAVRSRYVRSRRTFLVCLGTVLCYALSTLFHTVYFPTRIITKHNLPVWFLRLCLVLRVAGSHAINPLIYGIFDKKLLAFWKLCSNRKC